MMYDLLITNARILDGTGSPWFWGDLVLFDPDTLQDTATYENPRSYPTGVH